MRTKRPREAGARRRTNRDDLRWSMIVIAVKVWLTGGDLKLFHAERAGRVSNSHVSSRLEPVIRTFRGTSRSRDRRRRRINRDQSWITFGALRHLYYMLNGPGSVSNSQSAQGLRVVLIRNVERVAS